ncbi:RNA polymerase factor sigma-54 [Larsenimonas salina]|uniref:RNA polymerase factor sigma-54 n=1 Tax=Larsenimonas salina TaxID=1295565 RepID=UPI002074993A|nr:RNA polymerase factor sigma-54 [Larsenimonas salina]MCM5703109.1 RNA polymerase factor sigma-54 [Larsenimonas salina]
MTMKPSLQLRVGAHLTMTPHLQQAIHLLQLSTLDLRQEIQQALESNPMLEQQEALEEHDASPEPEADWAESIPDTLDHDSDWSDTYQDIGPGGLGAQTPSDEAPDIERNSLESTLQDHVRDQVRLIDLDDRSRLIADYLIDALDDTGRLSVPLYELGQQLTHHFPTLNFKQDELERTLQLMQQCEPGGLFARDLQECLLLQLDHRSGDTPLLAQTRRLIRQFLEALAGGDYKRLKRRLGVDDEQLEQIIQTIQSLDPQPGRRFGGARNHYVIPDLIMRHDAQKGWRVDLNEDALPRVQLNAQYSALIKRADQSQDNTFLKQHLQDAKWLLKSIASRNETLLKVGQEILARQPGFVEHGEAGLNPLTLADIAQAVDMHESTISRVTTQKYLHTPRGVVELKLFFSSQVGTGQDGDAHSGVAIRARIKKYVSEEPTRKPLSDAKLVELLDQQGIKVARRTVAKYREALGIPSSSERKRLA